MTTNFLDISYLKDGNERQKSAYQILINNQIFQKLAPFDPILTGTIPISIDIETSDLDIICYWKSNVDFIISLQKHFEKERDFKCRTAIIDDQETIIANFCKDEFEIEIFGQNIPSLHQNAYRHMLIEHQILKEKGEQFREEIINLKLNGMKTEPAFAKLLNLKGNPYEALLNYYV
ncbi:MAG: DUF4269 domain-containing protein [Pedobacter sp.]|nr:MAG: DUF4269 domain-containing protein [Pedobacter sp.]